MNTKKIIHKQLSIITDNFGKLAPNAKILDLGCGNGDIVQSYRELGYECYGCDLKFKEGNNVETLKKHSWIRLVDPTDYSLPFESNFFDVVLTNQVMEHVKDYESTLKEMSRVMKKGAIGLHIFPSRYRLIEPHVMVPMGTIIQNRQWLNLWALLGVKNHNQLNMRKKDIANYNFNYLYENTNYLNRSQIKHYFSLFFETVLFSESFYLKTSRRGKFLWHLSKYIPLIPYLYSELRMRVIVSKK